MKIFTGREGAEEYSRLNDEQWYAQREEGRKRLAKEKRVSDNEKLREMADRIEGRIGQDYDGECLLTEEEARWLVEVLRIIKDAEELPLEFYFSVKGVSHEDN